MAIFLAAMVLAAAGALLHFASAASVADAASPQAAAHPRISPVSLPLFFEPNQGQSDPQVKFLARGAGYGLFLTAKEAVLELHSAPSSQHSPRTVIRMRLAGANPSRVSGAEPLPGKSNYFISNDPAKWRRGIPQFARVNYESVYPGVDLTYYGNQGQLEYDFRIAPGADPNQIALSFDGASARLDAGDLVLSTGQGDIRFHAPHIYQQEGNGTRTVAGSFRQLAENKISFQIGAYDRNRELVIDPTLSYSTYLGGSGTESLTQIAVDLGLNMYVAGSTDSTNFPVTNGVFQTTNKGAQDIFIAKINASGSALVYATYLGGSQTDLAAGIAVDSSFNVYVAGTTNSSDFPTSPNAFQTSAAAAGFHGFLSKLDPSGLNLLYSTYLSGTNAAGTATDQVTGLAIDAKQNAFVTGSTTSTNSATGFPSTATAYQPCPFEPGTTCSITSGPTQFFASKINTTGSGTGSMLYSTYFGGNNPVTAQSVGGGIAVDASGNMYITGGTNFLGVAGPNGEAPFPLLNALDSCLDFTNKATCPANPTALDAFAAKINPNLPSTAGLVYSTYLGGSGDDTGIAIAVDSSSNAYVTGQTFSSDFFTPSGLVAPFQAAYAGNGDAFIAKIGNPTGTNTIFPMTYFTYIGGTNLDFGQAIAVDAVQASHVTGSTSSSDLPVVNPLQSYGQATDAFVGQISTTGAAGNYLTFLGGSQLDQGTGIAIDTNANAYVAGVTRSLNFPPGTNPPLFGQLNGPQDAFVARIGASSGFVLDPDPPVVSPSPVGAGNQASFAFVFKNNGPDPATNVVFRGDLPASGFTFNSASSTPGGSCPAPQNNKVFCSIGAVAAGSSATVTVVLVPTTGTTSLSVTPNLSANGGSFLTFTQGSVQVTDFLISAAPASVTVNAGESTSFVVTLTPQPTYSATISMSDTGLPTASTGTFTSTTVTLSGTSAGTTTLNVSTTARPANTGWLRRAGPLYATWLPVGGLGLLGLGLGAGLKRRRWLTGTLLAVLAAIIVLQVACGSSSSNPPPTGGTPAGTYTITITGSSGSASRNIPVTLIVN